ncbi:uncharacterized protein LOC125943512 [Dermacentor silvarum]|uniref:uncharacterized protein LOC125943512 n=1 Tax=Dermacentor silvarum TaxID=543639 RepID=UPI002100AB6F|nr:uncharacterized protein LOC125943512 [Dermacentor silvarum]
MNVTGRGEASLKVTKATSKLILKAKAETVKEMKMALLEVPADAGATPKGVNICTLSTSSPYLIAGLEKPLEVGKAYTLVTEYHYDKAAQGGPISLSAEFARMDLYPEKAHAAFPCFEKAGWNIPIALTLQTPKDLVAVSNAPMDGQPTVTGNMNSHKFKATPAMPTDMLAWAVFPTSLKLAAVIPNKVTTYMETEKEDLKASAKTAFEFLHKYFQAADTEHVPKIDMVFAQASEEQESLGFIVLDERTSADKICRTIANQWTYRLMRQPITPTWLASAGVTYLCRLAGTEESKLPAAFKEHLKECMKDNPTPGTRDLLAFRMVHIILGDAATQLAIQKYVTAHVFKSTATDDELGAFDPSISKDNLKAWVKESFKTKHLERALTPVKKITWKEADDSTTPFATATVNSAISLRAPTPVAVAWVKKTNADVTITIDDTKPLYVNPSMMACYGLKLDSLSWSLIGKDMEATPPDVVNGWYLLGEAAKQYKTVQRPGDFSGFMWTWAALKTGNEQLWDEHVKQFIDTESQAYSMLTGDETLEEKYKNRIIAVIAARLKAITQANIIPANREKPSVLLANLACAMKMASM